jgi:hypothetical protein
MYSDHGFKQAPYETITQEQYETMLKGYTPITNGSIGSGELELEECEKGACPIK